MRIFYECAYCHRYLLPWQKHNDVLHDICNSIFHRGYNVALSLVKDPEFKAGVTCYIPPETFMASTSPTGGIQIKKMT